ncbi:hypothetical protein N6G02_10865 [Cupriavidus gilardii]|uniref:Uncharacterized protein n=1 Tax=Cupriavidus gilardii TaxID=82541 RepID=A0A6N1BDD0_9BURK|nr:hypothetical protein [Cupriavidus gilardii]ALD89580.1 hypothetical protein CR3_0323 [Cupriavidus gilardii CR3]QQE07214.1 hypothetical protein IC580_01760 [Cupriavidus sp. ISTL7]KAB0595099.1 hypothetical protein F7Q96_18760 [Cupriavidus gilardii]MCT9016668.1 hypothetical protein [Cupriavidus gilardii]MCT9056357.1 hypothetical protein [Cupriavidus gilardii]
MDSLPTASYKGYELYPLVYRRAPVQTWPRTKPELAFDVSVMICIEGQPPGNEQSRLYRLTSGSCENVGTARRAAVDYGRAIIDGLVPTETLPTA